LWKTKGDDLDIKEIDGKVKQRLLVYIKNKLMYTLAVIIERVNNDSFDYRLTPKN
jgi:hypothetical protein